VLFLVRVLGGLGRGIATAPEIFDEFVALIVCREFLEVGALLIGNDVPHVFFQPCLVKLCGGAVRLEFAAIDG
jgi:hypothetical protein